MRGMTPPILHIPPSRCSFCSAAPYMSSLGRCLISAESFRAAYCIYSKPFVISPLIHGSSPLFSCFSSRHTSCSALLHASSPLTMVSRLQSRILIFGATGTIGQYITKSILQAQPSFHHVAIFTSKKTVETKPDLLGAWKARGVSVIVGDVTSLEDVTAAYRDEGPDTVISCLGRGALHTQTELIRLADESGIVEWFFPSEYGTDIEHGPQSATEKPHQNKLAVRKYIRENVKNLQVTYLVTGPYFDMWVNAMPARKGVVASLSTKKRLS